MVNSGDGQAAVVDSGGGLPRPGPAGKRGAAGPRRDRGAPPVERGVAGPHRDGGAPPAGTGVMKERDMDFC